MNRHFTEEELTLYYYGEARRREDIDAHLGTCTACATTYKEIAATLAMIATPDAPARGEQYGLEVWQRIRNKLPEQNAPWWTPWIRSDRLAWAAVAATIVVAAFVAGAYGNGSRHRRRYRQRRRRREARHRPKSRTASC